MDKTIISNLFASLGFEPRLIEEMFTVGHFKKYAEGDLVIKHGARAEYIPFVITGVLKIMRHDLDKGDILLYYLEGGATCAMSISCCLENTAGSFEVIAEEEATVWMVPMNQLDGWVVKYPEFRRFIFKAYRERFDEILSTIDSIAFMKMDERLTKYLLDKKQSSGSYIIAKTHGEIARELNTSRVVVSRLLKTLEKNGIIEQKRNRIEIL